MSTTTMKSIYLMCIFSLLLSITNSSSSNPRRRRQPSGSDSGNSGSPDSPASPDSPDSPESPEIPPEDLLLNAQILGCPCLREIAGDQGLPLEELRAECLQDNFQCVLATNPLDTLFVLDCAEDRIVLDTPMSVCVITDPNDPSDTEVFRLNPTQVLLCEAAIEGVSDRFDCREETIQVSDPPTPAPVSPAPTAGPTDGPTPAPVTPAPTNATPAPVTPAPTPVPTSSAPTSAAPTTPFPTTVAAVTATGDATVTSGIDDLSGLDTAQLQLWAQDIITQAIGTSVVDIAVTIDDVFSSTSTSVIGFTLTTNTPGELDVAFNSIDAFQTSGTTITPSGVGPSTTIASYNRDTI